MNQFFINGVKLETESLKSLNEAYYESDEALKHSKCHQAKITTEIALKRLQDDYFHYQVCYKDHFTNPRSQGCPRFQSGEELANSVGKINAYHSL